jgi:hypothetical protein
MMYNYYECDFNLMSIHTDVQLEPGTGPNQAQGRLPLSIGQPTYVVYLPTLDSVCILTYQIPWGLYLVSCCLISCCTVNGSLR